MENFETTQNSPELFELMYSDFDDDGYFDTYIDDDDDDDFWD